MNFELLSSSIAISNYVVSQGTMQNVSDVVALAMLEMNVFYIGFPAICWIIALVQLFKNDRKKFNIAIIAYVIGLAIEVLAIITLHKDYINNLVDVDEHIFVYNNPYGDGERIALIGLVIWYILGRYITKKDLSIKGFATISRYISGWGVFLTLGELLVPMLY